MTDDLAVREDKLRAARQEMRDAFQELGLARRQVERVGEGDARVQDRVLQAKLGLADAAEGYLLCRTLRKWARRDEEEAKRRGHSDE